MSRIDDLISKLTPEGVRFAPIGEVAECYSGATPASGVAEYWEGGTIPWMSSGEVNKGSIFETEKRLTQAGYDSCSTKMVPAKAVVMALAGQGKTRGMVARTRIALCTNQSLCSIIPNDHLYSDFLYYYLKTQYQQLRVASAGDGARGGLNLQIIRGYRVPVPPLEVQREIVRILDHFTELEAELEAELDAELEARRRQYGYYRRVLLEEVPGATEWDSVSLGDVCEIVVGFPFKSAQFSQSPSGVRLIRGDNVGQGSLKRSEFKRWERSASDGLSRYELQEDDLVLAMDRPWIPAGLKWARIQADDVPSLLVQRVARLRGVPGVIDQKFLGWVISSNRFTEHVLSTQTGNTVPHISGNSIADFKCSLPPLNEQERIATTIATFDALVNDLSVGLPAELNARRKQYEYYRDRLLTFDEAPA